MVRFRFVNGVPPVPLATAPPTTQLEHIFVSGVATDQRDAARLRREVRSHVAKTSAKSTKGIDLSAKPMSKSRSQRRRQKALVWPITLNVLPQEQQLYESSPRAFPGHASPVPKIESPVAYLPFIPLLLNNYLENLAVAVPELDGPHETLLLRKTWFPVVIHNPIVFHVIMLFSASHYAARVGDVSMASDILFLKQTAITGLRNAVDFSHGVLSDEIIASATKMASYEAIWGCEEAYHAHMNGVEKMVQLRGGMTSLGLDGFLARLIQFVDTNSAFLLNCKVHFDESSLPKLANQFLPNPSMFIGAS